MSEDTTSTPKSDSTEAEVVNTSASSASTPDEVTESTSSSTLESEDTTDSHGKRKKPSLLRKHMRVIVLVVGILVCLAIALTGVFLTHNKVTLAQEQSKDTTLIKAPTGAQATIIYEDGSQTDVIIPSAYPELSLYPGDGRDIKEVVINPDMSDGTVQCLDPKGKVNSESKGTPLTCYVHSDDGNKGTTDSSTPGDTNSGEVSK